MADARCHRRRRCARSAPPGEARAGSIELRTARLEGARFRAGGRLGSALGGRAGTGSHVLWRRQASSGVSDVGLMGAERSSRATRSRFRASSSCLPMRLQSTPSTRRATRPSITLRVRALNRSVPVSPTQLRRPRNPYLITSKSSKGSSPVVRPFCSSPSASHEARPHLGADPTVTSRHTHCSILHLVVRASLQTYDTQATSLLSSILVSVLEKGLSACRPESPSPNALIRD